MSDNLEPVVLIERRTIFRHPAWLRATHWINAICLTGLFLSGLQVFNAHPALYFGNASDFDHPVFSISANEDGTKGFTSLLGHAIETTGTLGVSRGPDGNETRGFPRWITVPAEQNLATGRRWHFLFAWCLVLNGIAYLVFGTVSGHLARDVWPRVTDLAKLPRSIYDHLMLRFPRGDEARHYNVLQKLTYAGVVFLVIPLMIFAGLTMSPGMDAAFPTLLQLFGGRQTARTVHFVLAWTLVLFVLVHVAMALLTGLGNNLRSMLTGRFRLEETRVHDQDVV